MAGLELDDLTALEKLGAEARRRGEGRLANPFFRGEMMPERTGEPAAVWLAKGEAWTSGWLAAEVDSSGAEPSGA